MMDYTGLTNRYTVNRKLTAEEKTKQLKQKQRLEIEPFYDLSVIKMNSTYLECVDRWFGDRGSLTATMVPILLVPVWALSGIFLYAISVPFNDSRYFDNWLFFLFAFTLGGPLTTLVLWHLLRECFTFTHFPIRFNQRNRMVYVFRRDGTVLSAKWDDIFFTFGRCMRYAGSQTWDVRALVLDRDKQMVIDTFALPGDSSSLDQLSHVWEFVRRYMEEGPESVYNGVYWCHDIDKKRETYRAGLVRLFFIANGLLWAQILMSPMFFIFSLGRWLAVHTSKIPVWPAEIEAECVIEREDPYLREAARNPAHIPMDVLKSRS